jgi:FMN phosphatase YigB (HAD superfamily)
VPPHSLDDARALIIGGSLRAFSFDIFDTMLLRRCTTPTGVFEQTFALAPIPGAYQHLREAFVQHRINAEKRARRTSARERGWSEITAEEIYHHFPFALFGLTANDADSLAQAEFQAEQQLCFANPAMVDLITLAAAHGVRVGFLSDTYWTGDRLRLLLESCSPGLSYDFLYASCDWKTSKSDRLFSHYLKSEALHDAPLAHIGDNIGADCIPARRLGISAIHYPQANDRLAGLFKREEVLLPSLRTLQTKALMLDGGFRAHRRAASALMPAKSTAFALGVEVIGPVMAAFNAFVHHHVERLQQNVTANGGRAAVVFVARDGQLPREIWQTNSEPSAWIELNRRISMLAAASSAQSLVPFFEEIPKLNYEIVSGFLKKDLPKIRTYFQNAPSGIVSGKTFAAALPSLLSPHDITRIAKDERQAVMRHLRASIPDFDHCTDLILVDLGYSGTVQKSLRKIFDHEGLSHRLHGLYVISIDEDFSEIPACDSVHGFLGATVFLPHIRTALLSNISIFEQICSANHGSVKGYDLQGHAQHEDDPRQDEHRTICGEIRAGAVHYVQSTKSQIQQGFPAATDDLNAVTPQAAAILSRLLLQPSDEEILLFHSIKHDVNLGSQALAPMADGARMLQWLNACGPVAPQAEMMWKAGGMAAVSPLHGLLSSMMLTGAVSSDFLTEAVVGQTIITLISPTQNRNVEVPCLRDIFGRLRMRIPLRGSDAIAAVVVPATALPPRSFIHGLILQSGATIEDALNAAKMQNLPLETVETNGIIRNGEILQVAEAEGLMALPIPPLSAPLSVLTLYLQPLDGVRLLSVIDEF